MRRDEREGLLVYRFETLPDGVDAFVSTRRGGVSPPPYDSLNLGLGVGDEAERVVENRRRLLDAFGPGLERSVWRRQLHGNAVTVVGAADAGRGSTSIAAPYVRYGDIRRSAEEESIPEGADAMVTAESGLALCVTLADCVPVVIFDPERRVAGLAHAGWAGTVSRVSSRTVAVMRERFGSDPDAIVAAIGPSIGPAGYEVGAEVVERARAAFGERAAEVLSPGDVGRARFDLWAANRIDLEEAGVAGERIEVGGIASDGRLDEFFSHRREGGRTGRFVAAVSIRP